MKIFTLSVLVCLFSSCAKTSYIVKQGLGQFSLEWNGRDNEEVLADKKISAENKKKIELIIKYKKFFYKYFELPETPIYAETTILDRPAVSYLLIASPINSVEPIKHYFPIAGTFPYLGFFDKEDAIDYQNDLKEKHFTYMRPVYAYSTLNQLWVYDNILSSFFVYDDYRLAELIFHELTHTILFVKNDVNFNESLAQYMGKELAKIYFEKQPDLVKKYEVQLMRSDKLNEIIAEFANDYDGKLKEMNIKSKEKALELMNNLFEEKYSQTFYKTCINLQGTSCKWDGSKWNNARLAEFLTYQSKQDLVEKVQAKRNISLKELLHYLIELENEYSSSDFEKFTDFLKTKENL